MRSNDYDDGDGNNDGDCDGDSDSNNDNLLQFFCFTNFIFVLLFTALPCLNGHPEIPILSLSL